jgi:hypothetical protein
MYLASVVAHVFLLKIKVCLLELVLNKKHLHPFLNGAKVEKLV